MEFDKSRVYTALNADELKVGSKVILADHIGGLKNSVVRGSHITTLEKILDENYMYRFLDTDHTEFALAYLVEEPQSLIWTDLKIGDIIESNDSRIQHMIIGISYDNSESHLFYMGSWQNDSYLQQYHKVEK